MRNSRLVVISADKAKEFIRKFNSNVGTKEFIESCKKAGRLFKQK